MGKTNNITACIPANYKTTFSRFEGPSLSFALSRIMFFCVASASVLKALIDEMVNEERQPR